MMVRGRQRDDRARLWHAHPRILPVGLVLVHVAHACRKTLLKPRAEAVFGIGVLGRRHAKLVKTEFKGPLAQALGQFLGAERHRPSVESHAQAGKSLSPEDACVVIGL